MAYGNQFNNLFSSLSSFEPKREIISVNGLQEAKNYYLNRGENIILRDSNEDIIYIKTCDDSGKCNLKVYSCKDITEEALSAQGSPAVSRSDFESLKNELSELKELLKNEYNVKQYSKRNESTKSDSTVQREYKKERTEPGSSS